MQGTIKRSNTGGKPLLLVLGGAMVTVAADPKGSPACQRCSHFGQDERAFWDGGGVERWSTLATGSQPASKATWPYLEDI